MNKDRHYESHLKRRAETAAQRVLKMAGSLGVLRARDLVEQGIPRIVLSRLEKRGLLKRSGRGLYVLPESDITEFHAFAEASKRIPQGVICLLSALRFHGLTTQSPFEVWLAIGIKARKPRVESPPLRIVRFSCESMVYGVERHLVEGVPVRITSPAKTVADCFKYRNKIGLDAAMEALRDYRRLRKGSLDDLWRAAEVCRVTAVIRPYLEAIR